jgi:hypothetical protein
MVANYFLEYFKEEARNEAAYKLSLPLIQLCG